MKNWNGFVWFVVIWVSIMTFNFILYYFGYWN